jgi:predicted enzyme related to lactoylglutathione lyase
MITGVHALIYPREAERARAFFRDVLEWPSVDAGEGWLIFALPPSELAIHPADPGGGHELYLLCDDVRTTVEALKLKGIEITTPIADKGWGLLTSIRIPGGGEIGLYQPRHPSPLESA